MAEGSKSHTAIIWRRVCHAWYSLAKAVECNWILAGFLANVPAHCLEPL